MTVDEIIELVIANEVAAKRKDIIENGLNTSDVARLLKVSDSTVKRWGDASKLTTMRKSRTGHRRFNVEEIAAMVKDPVAP
jgi:DNA invertase Pin-like site-specific DNA recombinase